MTLILNCTTTETNTLRARPTCALDHRNGKAEGHSSKNNSDSGFGSRWIGTSSPSRMDGIDQELCQERLSQIGDASDAKCLVASCLGIDGGHEDDRQPRAGRKQSFLQIDTRDSAQMDVQKKTLRFAFGEVIKKQLRR